MGFDPFFPHLKTAMVGWVDGIMTFPQDSLSGLPSPKDAICSKQPSGHDGMWKDLCS
jgi:hypothetical protein